MKRGLQQRREREKRMTSSTACWTPFWERTNVTKRKRWRRWKPQQITRDGTWTQPSAGYSSVEWKPTPQAMAQSQTEQADPAATSAVRERSSKELHGATASKKEEHPGGGHLAARKIKWKGEEGRRIKRVFLFLGKTE
jgi:hypothetical protein